MESFRSEFEIDLDKSKLLDEFDDGEQNLEEEAQQMLGAWDRDQFMKEVQREVSQRKNMEVTKDHYDGDQDFDDIIKDMTQIGQYVYVKILKSNPQAKKIERSTTIMFDIVGYLEHDATPFESSYVEGRPKRLNLNEGPAVPGFIIALLELREGEKANILIKPELAYGQLGCPPIVPEDASLFYNIQIYQVFDESKLSDVIAYEEENAIELDIDTKLKFIDEHKNVANNFLQKDFPRDAIVRYKAALGYIDDMTMGMKERPDVAHVHSVLAQNASIALNRLGMHKSATKLALRSLSAAPNNMKAYYQLVKARVFLADYSGALKWLNKVDEMSPKNREFDKLRADIDKRFQDEKIKRDEIMIKMSKAFV